MPPSARREAASHLSPSPPPFLTPSLRTAKTSALTASTGTAPFPPAGHPVHVIGESPLDLPIIIFEPGPFGEPERRSHFLFRPIPIRPTKPATTWVHLGAPAIPTGPERHSL